jgi:hypothetical protein
MAILLAAVKFLHVDGQTGRHFEPRGSMFETFGYECKRNVNKYSY